MQRYPGLLISRHTIKDAASKDAADGKLYDWEYTHLTVREWMHQLECGNIIILGTFNPNGDGKYSHTEDTWVSTHHILADGDHIKGVEFDKKTGEDLHPNGVDPWTDSGQLSIMYPDLLDECYAVGESVNSMSKDKLPLHRRSRIVFMFDQPITCGKHYRQILGTLSQRYAIISTDERQPAQPVYGNARQGHNKFYINGKVLKLADFPYIEPEPEPTPAAKPEARAEHKPVNDSQGITLQEFLDKNNVPHTLNDKTDPRYPNRFFVACPEASKHQTKTGEKHSFVWDDGKGFAFHCSHKSCLPHTWDKFKAGYNIIVQDYETQPKRKSTGRKSNAEKASALEMPETFKEKPTVFLNEVETIEETPIISERSREVVAQEVGSLLWKSDRIYTRGDEIGTLKEGENSLFFKGLKEAGMQGEIARSCSLMKIVDGSPSGVANPPRWIAEDLLSNQTVKNGRQIKVVLTHPFWNGTEILFKKGYDPDTQAYLDCDRKFDIDTSKHTAEEDLKIWEDLLCDFPFRETPDFENAMAYVITLIIRQGLSTGETTPLIDITAPREGVGKSLLADVLTAAVLGRTPITRSLSTIQTEVEKEIAAALRGAPENVIFDNVDNSRPLDCATLASVVTQPNRAFRILGFSEEMFYENRATILYTGSNIEVTPELAKRLIAIRLADTGVAEKDRKVKIEGLLSHTLQRHTDLLSSALRMVQRWIDTGSQEGPDNLHRMRQWSRVVHGIMLANGFGEHFMQNFNEVMLQASPEFTAWANAFKAIANDLGEKAFEGWTTQDVFEILSYTDNVYAHEDDIFHAVSNGQRNYTRISRGQGILDEVIGTKGTEQSRKTKLGLLLRKKTGNVHGIYELVDTHTSDRAGKKIYKLVNREKPHGDTPASKTTLESGEPPRDFSPDTQHSPRPDEKQVNGNQLDRFLTYIDRVPILSLDPNTAASLLGTDKDMLGETIKNLLDEGKIKKSVHDGEECFEINRV